MHEKILILDFGSQYTQLIARKIRELNTYCEIYPYNHFPQPDASVKGVILSGSPFSVHDANALHPDLSKIRGIYPMLGVCYGAQYLAHISGGVVSKAKTREYGRAMLNVLETEHPLMHEVPQTTQVWMSHGDTIQTLPENFRTIACTQDIPVGAFAAEGEPTFGLQYHPEVFHSTHGQQVLKNFLTFCGCSMDWTAASFVEETIKQLRTQIGNDKVVLGLSGGVDSSVTAVLLHKAIGDNLTSIFVDHGLLRKNEFQHVMEMYEGMGLNVIGVNASDKFFADLKGETDPEKKRKIIGRNFIEVFDQEAHKIQEVKWLGQGTIYPDIIESVSVKGPSATIKSHHNVGGLPDKMKLKLVEPLRLLFKDEVRKVGAELGLSASMLGRHPFPGPGLAVRILGEVNPKRVAMLQDADDIFIRNLRESGLYDTVWQAFVVLLPIQTVGVMGDERTYENAVALRSVNSTDAMTADWSHLPYEFLAKVSSEIINQVKGINRVVYDISSKPPATIEWE